MAIGIRSLLVVAAAAVFGPAAAQTACPQHFLGGQPPQVAKSSLAQKTDPLCYEAFGLLHSGVSRTSLWAAERLTRENVTAARELVREDNFQPDPNLLPSHRAELRDYARSGLDRGHLIANSNLGTREAQREAFYLSNMIPQNSTNNQTVWVGVETAARYLAKKDGEIYVITGPAYLGAEVRKIGKVLVPTHIFKAIYSPKRGQGAAYFIENTAEAKPVTISIAELEARVGINLFPQLPAGAKQTAMHLPTPRAGRGQGKTEEADDLAQAVRAVVRFLK